MPTLADVLCFSHLRWGFVYQRPNHLMSRCAQERRVLFVEEPLFDSIAPRLELSPVADGLTVAVPHLPSGTDPVRADRMQRLLLDGGVERARLRAPVLWFYTPMAIGYARHLHASAIVYDCMDELSHFAGAPPEMLARERELLAVADVVFTGGHSLFEAKRGLHRNVHAFPSSVDMAHFVRARRELPDPTDQSTIPRPRVGFFGVVDERMDLALVDALARDLPSHQFVFIGPVTKIDPRALPRRRNIHWLGPKEYDELPSYIAGWDVAMMPFSRNDATKYISPTKTLEYLAAGKPVVSTPIEDVVRPYGDKGLVQIADGPQAFGRAVETAVGEETNAAKAGRRDQLLAGTSWDLTWTRMRHLVLEAVEARRRGGSARSRGVREEDGPCSIT